MENINMKISDSYRVTVFIAGPIEYAKIILSKYCMSVGLCVTIKPVCFVYSGGEETGMEIGLINYPRFPKSKEKIWDQAVQVANLLLESLSQRTALVSDDKSTLWLSIDLTHLENRN